MIQDDNGKFLMNGFRMCRLDTPDPILKQGDNISDMSPWAKNSDSLHEKKSRITTMQMTASGRKFTSSMTVVCTDHVGDKAQGSAEMLVSKGDALDTRSFRVEPVAKILDSRKLDQPMGRYGEEYPMPKEMDEV
jgi:hypothetical protein